MKTQTICAFAAGAFLLTGCSSVYETPRDEVYNKAFMDVFGQIDPQQDWSLVGKKTVTVNASQPIDLKISVYDGEVYRLAAHFPGFTGTETINFDGIKGYDDIIVSDGASSRYVTSGASVSFASTRGFLMETNIANGDSLATPAADLTTFPASQVFAYAGKAPENEDNVNKPGIVTDFAALKRSERTMTIYPVYWNTTSRITLGIYTKISKDGKEDIDREVDIFSTDEWHADYDGGNDFMYSTNNGKDWTKMVDPVYTKAGYYGRCFDANVKDYDVTDIRVRGIELNIPSVDTEFGFYIKVSSPEDWGNGNNTCKQYYTESKLNPDGKGAAAFFRGGDDNTALSFIGFDDCSGDDNDLNDLVLIIDPHPIIVTHAPMEYIVACEDLGSDDDFDFNDIVFSIKHTVGEEIAHLTPLAAGGTIPAEVFYKDQSFGGEIHSLFGAPANEMVNTGDKADRKGKECTIDVDAYFTLFVGEKHDEKYDVSNFLHTISIKLNGTERQITPPARGEAPQMIIVPANWRWPKERVRIDEAYGTEFEDFVKDYQNTEWYLHPIQSKVTDR